MTGEPLLSIRDLRTVFHTDDGLVRAVDGVSFDVGRGETVCIVGESGSGKTVTGESITRLLRTPPGEIAGGEIVFDGRDLTTLDDETLRSLRGDRIAHVFQNPQGALNPVYTVGWQIVEAIQLHEDVTREAARERAVDLLDRVGIPEATRRFEDYPHEFSGGMKQRVAIAMALATNPDLLIADEPTTALDVTIQNQILSLLDDLQTEFDMSVLLITHDLGVVAEVADRVVVMYAGKVMERGGVFDVFERPSHPYTRALLDCLPGRGDGAASIGGRLPSPIDPPAGCRFHPRCEYAVDACREGEQPPDCAVDGDDDHVVSCVHYEPGGDPSVVRDRGSPASGDDEPADADGPGPGAVGTPPTDRTIHAEPFGEERDDTDTSADGEEDR
ncbi:ABC transporter ATP-binding protein [Haloplanus salinarum]|uniref:ABC transporter ATP-binding protein n=1 Tax=Haloplanus salinarum TaxID=1912324 RepID=UPI00214B774E|nr:ABC transporter ATP-binding protein [Haloplanus salinarum]